MDRIKIVIEWRELPRIAKELKKKGWIFTEGTGGDDRVYIEFEKCTDLEKLRSKALLGDTESLLKLMDLI